MTPPTSHALRRPGLLSDWRRILPFVLIFVLACVLYIRHNRFPKFYYSDEKIKVRFVMTGVTAFNHPLLLMQTCRTVAWMRGLADGKEKHESRVHVLGRTTSAVFAALAVLALMGIAFLTHGAAGAWCVGLVTALSPLLLTLAHYMKEDTALLFGLALTFLAIGLLARRPGVASHLFLGIATGIAFSGKYVGIIALPFALAALWRAGAPAEPPRARWARLGRFLLALLLTVALINATYFTHFREFNAAFGAEAGKVTTGRNGVRVPAMALTLLLNLGRVLPWTVIALALAYLVRFAATWRRRNAIQWQMLLFPLVYFVLFATGSRVMFVRYLLPLAIWIHYWAGLGILETAAMLPPARGLRSLAVAVLLALTLGFQGVRCASILGQFADDSRERLARWAAKNLPPQAHVLEDEYVRLASYQKDKKFRDKMPFKIESLRFAPDFAPFNALRQKGITHVAVCSMAFHRYLTDEKQAIPGFEADVQRIRNFYERLFKEGDLVWQAEAPDPVGHHTNPWIYLFRLTDVPARTPARWSHIVHEINKIQE